MSINVVRHCFWARRPGAQSTLHFILKVFSWFEVRFHLKLIQGLHALHNVFNVVMELTIHVYYHSKGLAKGQIRSRSLSNSSNHHQDLENLEIQVAHTNYLQYWNKTHPSTDINAIPHSSSNPKHHHLVELQSICVFSWELSKIQRIFCSIIMFECDW